MRKEESAGNVTYARSELPWIELRMKMRMACRVPWSGLASKRLRTIHGQRVLSPSPSWRRIIGSDAAPCNSNSLEKLVILFEAQPLWEIIRGEFGVGRDKVGHGLTTDPGHVGVCARERCVSPRGHPDETRCFARTLWILQVDKG